MNLRDRLLSRTTSLQSRIVEVWGEQIAVRSMTAGAQARMAGVSQEQALFKAIIECCYDPETGDRLFQDSDREWLEAQDGESIAELGAACMGVSGLDDEKPVDSGKGDS